MTGIRTTRDMNALTKNAHLRPKRWIIACVVSDKTRAPAPAPIALLNIYYVQNVGKQAIHTPAANKP